MDRNKVREHMICAKKKKDKRLLNDCKPTAPKMIRTKPTQRILDYLV